MDRKPTSTLERDMRVLLHSTAPVIAPDRSFDGRFYISQTDPLEWIGTTANTTIAQIPGSSLSDMDGLLMIPLDSRPSTAEAAAMDVNALFTQALGMVNPWEVVELKFDAEKKRLDIRVDFAPGSTFPCPACGMMCKAYDASSQEWRHLNFFEHLTFIQARQPRTNCEKDGVKTATVPWARPGSGFTLLCEAMVVELARNGLTTAAIGRIVGEHDTRIWRVLEHYVDEARDRADFSEVEKIGVDETSRRRGHVYVTLFADIEEAKVLFVTEGKDHETVTHFKKDLVAHGGESDEGDRLQPRYVKGLHQRHHGRV